MRMIAKPAPADGPSADIGPAHRPERPTAPAGEPILLDQAGLRERGVFGFDYDDPRGQPFMMLRSQVLRRLNQQGHRILAVTSTQPRNGKSFIAGNLAAALSQIHPTCLVDLDLRRPAIAGRFGIAEQDGSDDFLLGQAPLSPRRYGIGGAGLMIVPVGRPRANSADMLASGRTAALFRQLRDLPGAPVCIVDTPPALEGDDMMLIAQHVDAVLMVVEEGHTRRPDLRRCLDLLHPAPILGTVLNRVILGQSQIYGQYHGYRPL